MPLRIFITTDNHVGFNELDPVRGEDAAAAFDEAMSIAQAQDVDLVVQGGDLFHVNKPSKKSLYSVMKTLRKTCLSDKPVEFQVLNHGPLSLDDAALDHPNFEDPNLNVGLPVFAISGNHDDAGGSGTSSLLSPLDVLSMSGLINHFGRIHDVSEIVVTPILIEKAGVRVALYGMASVRDERLYRTFRDNKVKFLRPREEPDAWYNILVVHQNHAQHGPTNFLPEQFLPNFMDLVVWGHEHECLIDPTPNLNKGFQVMQPGSTVATSLSESELKPKHVAVLTISANKTMSCETFRLQSVRPFAMKTVVLATDAPHIKPNSREVRAKVTEWLMDQVELLIEEAQRDYVDANPDREPPLPLIRLRVDYSGGYEIENTTRFSNRFIGRVANSNDVLHLIKKRQTADTRILPKTMSGEAAQEDPANNAVMVGELVHKYLASEQLQILLGRSMDDALTNFVEKDEKLALKIGVDDLVQKQVDKLLDPIRGLSLESAAAYEPSLGTPELRDTEARRAEPRRAEPRNSEARKTEARKADLSKSDPPKGAKTSTRSAAKPAKGKPQARARSSRAAAHQKPTEIEDSDEEMSLPEEEPPKQRATRPARAKTQIARPIEPSDEEYPEIGDDSDEMFSPDE